MSFKCNLFQEQCYNGRVISSHTVNEYLFVSVSVHGASMNPIRIFVSVSVHRGQYEPYSQPGTRRGDGRVGQTLGKYLH